MEKKYKKSAVFGRVLSTGRFCDGVLEKNVGNVAGRRFSESLLFVLGLVFVIVYFAGLLYSAGNGEDEAVDGAVAVFAESRESGEKRDSVWDKLDRCFEHVFGKEGGEEK